MIKAKHITLRIIDFLHEQYLNRKPNKNNSITNNITKKNTINNTENTLNAKKDYSYKTYVSNNFKSQTDYVENNL